MATRSLEFWQHQWNVPADYHSLLSFHRVCSTFPLSLSPIQLPLLPSPLVLPLTSPHLALLLSLSSIFFFLLKYRKALGVTQPTIYFHYEKLVINILNSKFYFFKLKILNKIKVLSHSLVPYSSLPFQEVTFSQCVSHEVKDSSDGPFLHSCVSWSPIESCPSCFRSLIYYSSMGLRAFQKQI